MPRHRRHLRLLVFTIGVLLLLLRPYFVYQMTGKDARNVSPARAWSLLQRLVKKKDDHHEQQAAIGTAILECSTDVRPGRKLLASLSTFLCLFFRPVAPVTEHPAGLFLFFQRQRYRLSCCLLI